MTLPDGNTPAPEGQVWLCAACGKTARTRYGLRDSSCRTWAVLCYEQKNDDGKWVAVTEIEAMELEGTVEV